MKRLVSCLHRFHGTLDPFTLCKNNKIDIRFVNMPRQLGQFISGFVEPLILLSKRVKYNPVRYYVAARELYYALNETRPPCCKELLEEYGESASHADAFAKELLTQLYIERHGSPPDPKELETLCRSVSDFESEKYE